MKPNKILISVSVAIFLISFGVAVGYLAYHASQKIAAGMPLAAVSQEENFTAAIDNSDAAIRGSAEDEADYFTARLKKIDERVAMLAFGDLLLDRYIKISMDKYGNDYPFQNIKQSLSGNDFTLANLEGSFTDFSPNKPGPNMASFTFDPKLIPAMKNLGFNIFSLANNHTQDFGRLGLAQSQAYLKQNDIDCFGTFNNDGEISVVKDINGLKIGFVGYDEFGGSFDAVIAEIKNLKPQVDHVVVMPHWGIEYQTVNSPGQREKGRQFIDAGADLVLGGHPHVVQPLEIYKGRLIVYSMGNFVFDQIFSAQVQRGLAIGAIFTKDEIDCYLLPTQNKDFVVSFAADEAKAARLNDLAARLVASEDFKNQITQGKVIIKTAD